MKQPSIVVIDYGVGNTHSVWSAIRALEYRRLKISRKVEDILSADVLVLPGVGAFEACMQVLRAHHLDDVLSEAVLIKKKPILGICVGMQLMADTSDENGRHSGLGWIPGKVVKLELPAAYSVPHVGWNELEVTRSSTLFAHIGTSQHFYFDHSYHYQCNPEFIVAKCHYSKPLTAAIAKDHIYGVQFHPEKSQVSGLRLFRGFINAAGQC